MIDSRMPAEITYSPARRIAAWSVHLYTALGLPLMYLAATELLVNYGSVEKDASLFFFWIWVAIIVDSTDGMLARAVEVQKVLPEFSGRRLDDIVDFLSFAFLPSIAFGIFGLFPEGWSWFCVVPIMASGYGFCQEKAKTEDAFVGFPSYWNVVLLYLFLFQVDPWANLAIVGVLAALVFVPIHYIYPTKTALLKSVTLVYCAVWVGTLIAISLWPKEPWTLTVTWISLSFPVYYIVLSIVHHIRVHRGE